MFPLSLLVAFSFACCLAYKYVLYPALLSPLSKIPNAHLTSSISSFWILNIRSKKLENRTLLSCHQRFGSIIRLSPNELSVNCVDGGLRAIYSGGFEKHDWYTTIFDNYGVPCMFSMANSKPHSARKRLISNVYSKSHLQSSQDMHTISQILLHERFLPILESAASSGSPIDVHELNFAAAMDFINAYIFGLENGSNFLEDVAFRKHFLDLYHSRKTYTFWPQELPKVTSLLHILGIRVVPKFVDAANREIERWCLSMCMASKANVQTSDNPSNTATPSTRPVVYSQLAESLQQPSTQTTDKSASHEHDLAIASELLDELAAGHETSGITLTYLMHELSQRPNLQANLREELLTLSPSLAPSSAQTNIPSSRALDALPLLHALLLETLRLHAAIPGPQPRVTPSTPTTLAGYDNIPPHTRVSALAYTLHRNATVFPDPLAWKPERWLEADKEQKEEMMRWFWAFGSGGRMCIGSNFAMQEMKLLIAAIYTNFTTSIVDDDGIEQEDAYTAGPTGNRLILRFERVD